MACQINVNGTGYTTQTTAVYRDPSSWYHVVYALDTTQATASNRVKMYINGVQITSFSSSTYPTQNLDTYANSTVAHYHNVFGSSYLSTTYACDQYLAEINFIDGQALTPSSFGKTNAVTGQWIPKKYGGTYGTNGFYLKFADASAATAAAIGKDSSGNGNNWTPNNISVTSGVTYDSMTDVPTLTSPTVANYCTLNPLDTGTTGGTNSITNGNLSLTNVSGNYTIRGTIGMVTTGKFLLTAPAVLLTYNMLLILLLKYNINGLTTCGLNHIKAYIQEAHGT